MRKFLSSLLIVITTISLTFSSNALQIDEKINEILNPISVIVVSIVFFSVEIFEGIKVPLIVVWLIIASLFCTLYFGFVNIRQFGTAIKIFRSNEPSILYSELEKEISLLKNLIERNSLEEILSKLKNIVIDYSPSSRIVDHTYEKNS